MFISCSCDTHAAVTAGTHDPFMEVAPRPKKEKRNELLANQELLLREFVDKSDNTER